MNKLVSYYVNLKNVVLHIANVLFCKEGKLTVTTYNRKIITLTNMILTTSDYKSNGIKHRAIRICILCHFLLFVMGS